MCENNTIIFKNLSFMGRIIIYNIGIRADGGTAIGLGHLMRCLSLALEFNNLKNNVYFISNEKHDFLTQYGFEVIKVEKVEDLDYEIDSILKIIDKYTIDCLIVDHYGVSTDYMTELSKNINILVYIDDFCKNSFSVDILINGNIYVDKDCYPSRHKKTNFLLGNKYTLLRKEFLKLPRRKIKKAPSHIMITTGGSDNQNLTIRLLKILIASDLTKYIQIKVVIGKNFKNNLEIEDYAKEYENMILHYNVSNMAKIMRESDLALSTSGTSLYELAITGTPSISFIKVNNQERSARKMNELNCTMNLGWYNQIDDSIISERVIELLKNYNLRKEMSKLGQKIFDGKGALRCVRAILTALKKLEYS